MEDLVEEEFGTFPPGGLDLATFGQRLRHLRRTRGLTLADLGTRVGRAPSVLSLLENGRREPKLSLIEALARALSVPTDELLRPQPPSRRAQLEIMLEEAQRDPAYRDLGLPYLKAGARVPTDVLEHVIALYGELRRQRTRPTATPEEARIANAELRQAMREQDNYFAEIEGLAAQALGAVGYSGGALSQGMLMAVVAHHGFAVSYAEDLPRSVRSVTDLRHRRIYLKQEPVGTHSPRTIILQTLGHFILDHDIPRDFADFLRQRVEANYFAGAVLLPERWAAQFLIDAKKSRELSVEDLRDVFSVSYEMAAHRFTNLVTHHLGLPCHFTKNDEAGVIYKAYENDGLVLPADPSGAIEGQRMCRQWSGRQVFQSADRYSPYYQYSDTPSGTYWCMAHVDSGHEPGFAITLGTPYEHSRWFRGRDTTLRRTSGCPDGDCCQRPPSALSTRWDGMAWPSARAHAHILSALPTGSFPGVDDTDVYEFLDRHAKALHR
ncbi:MAG TPA: helix-turn-helix domain-containing protein [Streptosporangiaceae bacterium]|nr:helix-turn-helix domain-containing protein [Streptosporangiaceae bacterium]